MKVAVASWLNLKELYKYYNAASPLFRALLNVMNKQL